MQSAPDADPPPASGIEAGVAESAERAVRCGLCRRWLRIDFLLLWLAFTMTVAAKGVVIHAYDPRNYLVPLAESAIPDVIFFACTGAAITALHLFGRGPWMARCTLLAASAVLAWSGLNVAWMVTTSVQLQPGVLRVLFEASSQFGSVASTYLLREIWLAALVVVGAVFMVSWIIVRLIRPQPIDASTRRLFWRMATLLVIVGVVSAVRVAAHQHGPPSYSGQVIGFSSHWFAISQLVLPDVEEDGEVARPDREAPRAGERILARRPDAPSPPPNVLIVMLESVYYRITSLGEGDPAMTPHLVAFAADGVELAETRVPMPQTTKAFWSALSGSLPEIGPGHAESVYVEQPYESLATILGGAGYRTGFFQMSPGSFDCLAGFFHNVGFEHAWFPEDLADPAAKLSALTGDDTRLIEPLFRWIEQSGEQPFFALTISSVAHDPYVVPAWFDDTPMPDRFDRFHRAVQFSDHWLGQVLAEVERRGLAENTIICVMGDHGESFRPESRRGRWVPFEEVIRVPWIIRWPGHLDGGATQPGPHSQLDVAPTLLSLLGFDLSAAAFDGRDALAGTDPGRRVYFSSLYGKSPMGYIESNRKVVYYPATRSVFEYDLVNDPHEKQPINVEGEEKERVIQDVLDWQRSTQFRIPATRFREGVVFDRWRIFSSGRHAQAYYIGEAAADSGDKERP